MATTTIHPRETWGGFARIKAGFANVAAFVDTVANARACGELAMRLMRLSDAELASRGLQRDEIVQYAFRRTRR